MLGGYNVRSLIDLLQSDDLELATAAVKALDLLRKYLIDPLTATIPAIIY
jgi:aconitase B